VIALHVCSISVLLPLWKAVKMPSFGMIGEIVQSEQNKLEKSQDHCHPKL